MGCIQRVVCVVGVSTATSYFHTKTVLDIPLGLSCVAVPCTQILYCGQVVNKGSQPFPDLPLLLLLGFSHALESTSSVVLACALMDDQVDPLEASCLAQMEMRHQVYRVYTHVHTLTQCNNTCQLKPY